MEDYLNSLNTKLDEERMLEEKFANNQREMRDNNKFLKKQVNDIFQVGIIIGFIVFITVILGNKKQDR